MKQPRSPQSTLARVGQHWRLLLALAAALTIAGVVLWGWHVIHTSDRPLMGITHNERIESTPEEILALKDVGEWEFLSVETEELVEHHEPHTFGDTHLVKIYHGRLSLGIDMKDAADDWFRDSLSTAIITLPAITLLDDYFIDEARTVTFYEKGRHNAATKQRLYDKAAEAMMQRALAPTNVSEAQHTAREHFMKLMKPFGYKEVIVRFEERKTAR